MTKLINQLIHRSIDLAASSSIQVRTSLCLHADPGHVYPGDPDGGLGHVGHARVVPVHVQEHRVAPLNKTRRTNCSVTREVLSVGVRGSSVAPNNVCRL